MYRCLNVLALLLLASACSNTSELASQGMPGTLDAAPLQIQTQWQVTLSQPGILAFKPQEFSKPVYSSSGNTVIAGSSAGVLVAAQSRNGRLLWTRDFSDGVADGVTVSGSAVYAAGRDGTLRKLDVGTGADLWAHPYEAPGSITSAPSVDVGHVAIQTNENRTYVLDASTGEYVWDKGRMRPEGLTINGEGGATIDRGVVYAGYDDGVLLAMSVVDGSTLWSRDLSGKRSQFVDVDTRPLVRGDSVYAGSYSGGYYAVGRKHGNIRWHHPADGVNSATLGKDVVYVALRNQRVQAVDLATGTLIWQTRVGRLAVSEPVLLSSGLWVSTGDGVVWMDPRKGLIRARLSPDDGQTAPIGGAGGWIHMVTNSGALVGARVL